jgi:hypothetical protein
VVGSRTSRQTSSQILLESANRQTNLRVPLLWAESLKDGVHPCTRGWDEAAICAYTVNIHPGYTIFEGICERNEVIVNLVQNHCAKADADRYAVDRQRGEQVLRRDYPNLERPYRRSQDNFIGPGYIVQQDMSVDQFLGRSE